MRPHQWVKNLFVIAPLVFAKGLLDAPMVLRTAAAFLLFSLAASSIYVLNDLADVEADRLHPKKRSRPIASGRVPVSFARGAMVVLVATALVGGYLIAPSLAVVLASYVTLNIAYTFRLKQIAYVDVLCITAGFELRVLAGTYAAGVTPTTYLLVVTFLLATFLGLGKRMHELKQGARATAQRPVLSAYDERTLRAFLILFGAATVCTYFAYSVDAHTRSFFGTDYLAVTTPFTLFGVLRFLRLVQHRPDSESPTEEMLRDRPFLANLGLFGAVVVLLIYFA
jgi:decaprenyl-phosphate phosphoribosyltransferase